MMQNQLKHKITVNKIYHSGSATILGNEGKLHQAFLNILTNAENSIENKGDIIIETKVKKNMLIICFSDSGKGINNDNIHKVFDPFFTTKDPGKGTGLGLAITYNIIHEHNGTIDLDSQVDMGTKVTVRLPFNVSENQ